MCSGPCSFSLPDTGLSAYEEKQMDIILVDDVLKIPPTEIRFQIQVSLFLWKERTREAILRGCLLDTGCSRCVPSS